MKYARTVVRRGSEQELRELNKERLKIAGFQSEYLEEVFLECPHCGKPVSAFVGPSPGRSYRERKQLQREKVDPALAMYPPTEEEVEAEKQYRALYDEWWRMLGEASQSLEQLRKKNSRVTPDGRTVYLMPETTDGNQVQRMEREINRQIEELREKLGEAQRRWMGLYTARMRKITRWRDDQARRESERLHQARQEALKPQEGKGIRKATRELLQ